jgi:t-SNARE complex subunit, syntaxin
MSSFDHDPHNCRYVYFHRYISNRPLYVLQDYTSRLTDLYRHCSVGSNPLPTVSLQPTNMKDNNLFYTNLTQRFFNYCNSYLYGLPSTFLSVNDQVVSEEQDDHDQHHRLEVIKNHTIVDTAMKSDEKISQQQQQQQLPFVVILGNVSVHDNNNNNNNKKKKPSSSVSTTVPSPRQDVWMSNANRLYSSLRQIVSVLDCHSSEYTYKDVLFSKTSKQDGTDQGPSTRARMTEEEVTVFEASIASFLTSATSQIDTLRQSMMIQEENSSCGPMSEDVKAHRSGIVSHLVCELEQLMRDFQSMQKQRNRVELELYFDPLKCVYCNIHASSIRGDVVDDSDGDVFLQDDLELHSLEPDEDYMDMLEREEEHFQSMFGSQQNDQEWKKIVDEPLPFSFFPIVAWNDEKDQESKTNNRVPNSLEKDYMGERKGSLAGKGDDTMITIASRQSEILQQEQIFLNETVQNTDLDAAQSIESQMTQITSLLSQFSSLISEQQEEIQMIADSSANSRMNVTKGREKLVQATEQKKKSRHYFAWIIFLLGLLLLVFECRCNVNQYIEFVKKGKTRSTEYNLFVIPIIILCMGLSCMQNADSHKYTHHNASYFLLISFCI